MSLTNQNIESLLSLCEKGNQLAQLEVYNRYQKAMYNTAVRIVKDTAEAEDVMQESFITAFNKLHTFKGDATFGAWLKKIVVNNSITQYKKSQRYVAIAEENLEEFEETGNSITEEEYRSMKASQVLESMETIHDNYKQVLCLHFIEGFDYEEICEILQISYANCRTLISKEKQLLELVGRWKQRKKSFYGS